MSLAVVNSCNLLGFQLQHISVEVHIGTGLPAFNIVGLPDIGVRESRERVRSAILSSGFDFPAARITVNLAPADQPKASGRFDLPIAVGILLASGQVVHAHAEQAPDISRMYFVGELSLTGALLNTQGCLAIGLGLAQAYSGVVAAHTMPAPTKHPQDQPKQDKQEKQQQPQEQQQQPQEQLQRFCLVLPTDSAYRLAELCTRTIDVRAADSLLAVVHHLSARSLLPTAQSLRRITGATAAVIGGSITGVSGVSTASGASTAPKASTSMADHNPTASSMGQAQPPSPCLSQVRGQLLACQALELAATGGHSILMVGPPGVGKSMLARRLVTLLPRLTNEQQLEVAAIRELMGGTFEGVQANGLQTTGLQTAGLQNNGGQAEGLQTEGLQSEALQAVPFRAPHHSTSRPALVGGGRHPRPGEISLAHRGVLFLDEFAEFERSALEALREPLETGQILVSRASGQLLFPARFQLIAAMNPCPCGYWGHPQKACRCPTAFRQRYLDKVSGPILDRIDIALTLSPEGKDYFNLPAAPTSVEVRQRVEQAQRRQLQRQGCLNAYLSAQQLEQWASLCPKGQQILQQAVQKWHWSTRAIERMRRIARTIADVEQAKHIQAQHMLSALQFRHNFEEGFGLG